MNTRQFLHSAYYWNVVDQIPDAVCETLYQAANAISVWLNYPDGQIIGKHSLFYERIGKIEWKPSSLFWKKIGFH
ncbi:MAG TPA: hypothetical protein VF338_11470, partial [Leptolinea sp.]